MLGLLKKRQLIFILCALNGKNAFISKKYFIRLVLVIRGIFRSLVPGKFSHNVPLKIRFGEIFGEILGDVFSNFGV